MMPGARKEDRWFWIACLAGGVLVLAGCALPTIEIGQGAFIGAGDTQRGFDYERTIRLLAYVEPGSVLFVLGGLAVVGLSVVGLVRGTSTVSVVAVAVISLVLLVQVVRVSDELRWQSRSVFACERRLERCVPFLAPAIRDLQQDIRSRPEARAPEFELLDSEGYRARGKTGWKLVLWSSAALALVTAFRALRLVLRPVWAAVVVSAAALAFLIVLVLRSLDGLE